MKYAWDLPNSSLHLVEEDGSLGAEVGHCERIGDRHQEEGWYGFTNQEGYIRIPPFRIIFDDECMAMQAVLDAVEGRR